METRLIRILRRAILGVAVAFTLGAAAPQAATSPAFDATIAQVKAEMLADPNAAIDRARAAMRQVDREPDVRARNVMRATVQWLMGEAYGRLGESARALPMLMAARTIAERENLPLLLQADILLSEGAALTDTGRVTESLPTLQRAHELFRQLGQSRSRAKALILIAMLYDGARDHETALRYFAQARDAYAADQGLMVSILNGRGTALTALGRYAEANMEFNKALTIAHALKSDAAIALVTGNIVDAEMKLGNLSQAAETVRRGLAIARRPGAEAYRPQLLALAARIAFDRGDRTRAEVLIDERFAGVDLETTILSDRDAHDTAYRVYLADGQTALALRHLEALKRLDDRATEIARSNSAALAAARFDYANQELRIAKLKADDLTRSVAFERATARTQRLVFVGAAAATALLIALLAFGIVTLRRSRNEVRAANDDLERSNTDLEKALKAKTEFLATTSHEIRTPLNGILGMTQVMIADGALDATTRDRLSVVHGAGVTMRALVDDILDVAKIETGRMTIEAAPMDLHTIVGDATRMWREQAVAKGLAFTVSLDGAPRWIMGDAARLRQIVFNLLSNAVKFTATGRIAVDLAQGEDGRLRLAVEDSGIGIADEAQEVIFESFRQADTGTTRQFGGTGLGLSICRNLARAMDGDVTVRSRLGEGAVFMLDLPVVPADAQDQPPEQVALLVVERNPINRAMFKALFQATGATVFAGDAAEAAAVIAAQRPERVLVDLATLGEETPADALAAIVAAAGDAPVHLLAPACDSAARSAWLATGVAQVIERPIGKKSLVAAVLAVSTVLVPRAA